MRRSAGTVLLLLAAACWVIALFLPWAESGALSSSSLIDAARLVRRGVVDQIVPAWASFVILLPAAAGVALIAAAPLRGRVAAGLRWSLILAGSLVNAELVRRIPGLAPSEMGAGAWLALVGVIAAVAAEAARSLARRAVGRA